MLTHRRDQGQTIISHALLFARRSSGKRASASRDSLLLRGPWRWQSDLGRGDAANSFVIESTGELWHANEVEIEGIDEFNRWCNFSLVMLTICFYIRYIFNDQLSTVRSLFDSIYKEGARLWESPVERGWIGNKRRLFLYSGLQLFFKSCCYFFPVGLAGRN